MHVCATIGLRRQCYIYYKRTIKIYLSMVVIISLKADRRFLIPTEFRPVIIFSFYLFVGNT